MFSKIRRFGSRQVSVKTAVLLVGLVLMGTVFMGAVADQGFYQLRVYMLKNLSENNDLKMDGTWDDARQPEEITLSGASVYSVTAPGTFYVDTTQGDGNDATRTTGSGVSLIIAQSALTKDNDDAVFKFVNMPGYAQLGTGSASGASIFSGTTQVGISLEIASGNTPHIWNVTTGATYAVSNAGIAEPCEVTEIDAAGDYLAFKWKYDDTTDTATGGGTLYQTERYIQ